MALIRCWECGKKVSELSKNCPNCGYPLESQLNTEHKDEPKNADDIIANELPQNLSYAERKNRIITRTLYGVVLGLIGSCARNAFSWNIISHISR